MLDDINSKDEAIWYNYDLSNERQYTRCIKHLQKLIRGSMSYDVWQKRSKIGIQECPICGIEKDYVKMESHHYPKTLFDVVDDYMQYLIDSNQLDDKTDYDVCQEIMDMHFEKKVDYIVLCEYCHKKYHDDVPEILDIIDEKWREQKKQREEFFQKGNDNDR